MILTINAGSSSLKYAVFDADLAQLLEGLIEELAEGAHQRAIEQVVRQLRERGLDSDITVVAHRVVHGGSRFRSPTRIDNEVGRAIEAIAPLAPLHNPANLQGIRLARAAFPKARHVAVFDTAFHATLPEHAYRYAVPSYWYEQHAVRKYGFHGTSHAYVSGVACAVLAKADLPCQKLVTLHLGNGCSAAAIQDGRCMDTTMGLTPLAGLMMGTRSGNIDPGISAYLAREGIEVGVQETQLNKASGLKAIAGDNDMRTLLARRATGDEQARLAVAMFVYRIIKTVGAYAAVLGGLDGLVFTAGIGENSDQIREEVCEGLAFLGIRLSAKLNRERSADARLISEGECAVMVVPTDEERAMAKQAVALA